jgi:hypothetical protein
MDQVFTYQQPDTVKTVTVPDLSSRNVQPVTLDVEGDISVLKPFPVDTVIRFQPEDSLLHERLETLHKETHIRKPLREEKSQASSRQERKTPVQAPGFVEPQTQQDLQLQEERIPRQVILPAQRIHPVHHDWVTLILLCSLVLWASVRNTYAKYLVHLLKSTFNFATSARLFRERSSSFLDGSSRLDLLFYVVFSLFMYQVFTYFETGISARNFPLFLGCLIVVPGYFLFKKGIYLMIGFVVEGVEETREYLFNMGNYNRVLGLFLVPFVAVVAFSPLFNPLFFLIPGLILTGIFYGLTLWRGIMVLIKKQFSIFYLFLYLCTLEILPLLLIWKMVKG